MFSCLYPKARKTDVIGRIGGEEFAAFLRETDLQGDGHTNVSACD